MTSKQTDRTPEMVGSCFRFMTTRIEMRIGLFVGLAILGSQTVSDAQTAADDQAAAGVQARPGAGATDRPALPSTPEAAPAGGATVTTRPPRPASSSFQRVVTTRRSTVSPMTRGLPAAARPVAPEAMRQDDPLRPYSSQVRDARLQAATGTSRPQPRATAPRQTIQSSRSFYPGMRISRHPNASAAPPRRQSAGVGGMGMGTGMGGMGMGARQSTPARAGATAGGAARGR